MKTIVCPVSSWSRHHLVLHVAADERVERAERLVVEHHRRVASRTRARRRRAAASRPRAGRGTAFSTSSRPTSSSSSRARASRSAFAIPRISSPNATLSITRRWASRPKCWKTIETEWRRSSRSSAALARRDVLPGDPDRRRRSARSAGSACGRASTCPSPRGPSRRTPRPARPRTRRPARRRRSRSSRGAPTRRSSASGVPRMRSAFGPKIFQIPDAAMSGSPARPLPVTRLIYQRRRCPGVAADPRRGASTAVADGRGAGLRVDVERGCPARAGARS